MHLVSQALFIRKIFKLNGKRIITKGRLAVYKRSSFHTFLESARAVLSLDP